MAAGTRSLVGAAYGAIAKGLMTPFTLTKDLKFADIATVKGGTIEVNEVAEIITIPKGTFVQAVTMEVVTAGVSANALTASVGDGSSTAGFLAASDLKAAAGTVYGTGALTLTEGTPNTFVPAYIGGKIYTAADTLDVKVTAFDTVTTLPVVRVTALCWAARHA